jgi:hypothetical protein
LASCHVVTVTAERVGRRRIIPIRIDVVGIVSCEGVPCLDGWSMVVGCNGM